MRNVQHIVTVINNVLASKQKNTTTYSMSMSNAIKRSTLEAREELFEALLQIKIEEHDGSFHWWLEHIKHLQSSIGEDVVARKLQAFLEPKIQATYRSYEWATSHLLYFEKLIDRQALEDMMFKIVVTVLSQTISVPKEIYEHRRATIHDRYVFLTEATKEQRQIALFPFAYSWFKILSEIPRFKEVWRNAYENGTEHFKKQLQGFLNYCDAAVELNKRKTKSHNRQKLKKPYPPPSDNLLAHISEEATVYTDDNDEHRLTMREALKRDSRLVLSYSDIERQVNGNFIVPGCQCPITSITAIRKMHKFLIGVMQAQGTTAVKTKRGRDTTAYNGLDLFLKMNGEWKESRKTAKNDEEGIIVGLTSENAFQRSFAAVTHKASKEEAESEN